jgi:predicted F0F1-ATPase subunit
MMNENTSKKPISIQEKAPKTPKEEKEKLLDWLVFRAKSRAGRRRFLIFETASYLGVYGSYIIVPVILSAWAGRWLDKNYPVEGFSWVLNLVVLFTVLGFINATVWAFNEGVKKTQNHRLKEKEAVFNTFEENKKNVFENKLSEDLKQNLKESDKGEKL